MDYMDYVYEDHSSSNCFEQLYRCYPIDHEDSEKYSHLESGNKILLPVSALDRLTHMNVKYPMLFQLQNPKTGRVSHCGVMEFSSDEGEVWLPNWMMKNMGFEEGGLALIKNANLVKGKHIKLQPHKTDFINLSDPKAVLESTLKGFSCLTAGDTIMIMNEGKEFYIDVLETKPSSSAICIIDTDCEVDFAPPLDYKEPEKVKPASMKEKAKPEEAKFRPFMGVAKRLDGSPVLTSVSHEDNAAASATAGCSDSAVGRKSGKIVFDSSNAVGKLSEESQKVDEKGRIMEKNEEKGFQAFSGKSYRLT
ncbi:uncharacterized protein LOC107416383 [Ziziphus jujuba]|uniref:Uncharacterized protein LOC107416383 n=2 Tax=Ziziphus jujuba TaxID=326968 RepID=A0A6P4A370_ZIZJJ|nr:uncharacterized protein LOC107416383 [Ziziphus jujuba]KAH7533825.1 hypothetical protein FEM48_Zijuj04G0172800 [Ziziphus jujuba var. spinosa]